MSKKLVDTVCPRCKGVGSVDAGMKLTESERTAFTERIKEQDIQHGHLAISVTVMDGHIQRARIDASHEVRVESKGRVKG